MFFKALFHRNLIYGHYIPNSHKTQNFTSSRAHSTQSKLFDSLLSEEIKYKQN